jgi:hypothetical protein
MISTISSSGFWMWMSTILIANVQDFGYGMPTQFIAEVPSNLSILLMSKHMTNVPFWNQHIKNYVYGVFGFANKIPSS